MPCAVAVGPLKCGIGFLHGWLCGPEGFGAAVSLLVGGAESPVLSLVGGFQNGACQCWYYHDRMRSPMAAATVSIPQVSSSCPPVSPGVSPRSTSGSDPGSFQTTASALGLGTCGILHVPFKSRVCFLRPSSFLNLSPDSFQCQMFWEPVFPVQDAQAREPDMGVRPLAPWGESL